jgi:two-component system, OmpR family, phosphate regulon sensor histidine kinase PhoR
MSATRRIAVILSVVFLIPALSFSVYEISSLTKDEKMIENIYQKQLEAILFSVNQVSDATVTSWMAKAEMGKNEMATEPPGVTLPPVLQNLISLNSAIQLVYLVDTASQKANVSLFSLDSILSEQLKPLVESSLSENKAQIEQLLKYRKSGFQKIESISSKKSSNPNLHNLIFISEGSTNPWQVAGFIIDSELFVEDVVGPLLQRISKEQFVLTVFDKERAFRVYSTELNDTTSFSSASLTKDLWVFPNYALGIRTKEASLKQLVRNRTITNLYLLIALDVVLILALVIAFRSVKKEVQLAQNKADFVSNVSHEIRTPLALISMFAETLEMGRAKSEEKKQEYYSIINKETQRLSGIVNKILNFSQTEAGKKKLHLQIIDLTLPIKDVLVTYDYHLRNQGFEYHFEEKEPLHIMADKEAVTEIIINLIDNAMKYSPVKKRIEITMGKENGLGWLSVKDYGVGISAHDQKHIFGKFYRVSSGDLAKSRGTGLGLSLVKQLLEQQNGKISVSSELGKGSVFTVYLPLEKRSQNAEVRS